MKRQTLYSFGLKPAGITMKPKGFFNERFPDRPISRKYIRQLVSEFSTTASVGDKPRNGHPTIGEDTQVQIVAEMVVTHQQTTESVARTYDVSATTVKRVLHKQKFHPYKMQYLQCLTEDDPDRRIEFCELMTNRIDNNPSYLAHVCFSDESTFYLDEEVNRQNMRYWSDVNPHVFREGYSQYPEKLNVWGLALWVTISWDHYLLKALSTANST
ncbi:hypothetical protein NQ318_016110 [Aromia moschata]|uniref:Transposase n=1 Tax=Aromia moschata TaxID=1265417 RepID=A0AAV8XE36_9CUCU|nr:hypothetical protein NQ318_016110 [Aromia moschata]